MLLRTLRFSIFLLCALSPWAGAQTPTMQPPTIWIAPDQGLQPIRLSTLDIHIRTQGFIAHTTLDLTFDNPNDRVLEGEFVFPLAAGQAIAGYALEVNGAMREGVVVDKQTARVAFENTIRQQIDPGLAELTTGNVFRTRLYPIPARGSKRVRLHIQSLLADQGSAWRYSLPMSFSEPVAHLHVRAEALLGSSAPLVDTISGDPALQFAHTDSAWVAELTRENVRPQKELAFRIPKGTDGDVTQVEAIDPIDPAWRSVIALVDSGLPKNAAPISPPRRIALFFDASASAEDRDLQREYAALQAYLKTLATSEVTLIAFRNDADAAQTFSARKGEMPALLSAIKTLPLDGASSYGAIDLHGLGTIDQVLIVGDGLSNFAEDEAQLAADNGTRPPVFVLHAAQRADHARLARLAQNGGGQVIDLAARTPAEAVTLLQQRAWRLLATEVTAGECREISSAGTVRAGSTITVSARCRGQAELAARFGYEAGDEVLRTLHIGKIEAAAGTLADSVHRLWAQAIIEQLYAMADADESAIAALAKRYAVVTRNTSLLVLDRIEDYVRYRVEPKETALRAEYQRLLAQQPKSIADPGLAARLESLAARWKEFRDYHAASYPGIESLLRTMASAEAQAWLGYGEDKRWAAGRLEAKALQASVDDLVARWLREGGEPESRAKWEREAARIVFAIETLRTRRAKLPDVYLQTLPVTGGLISDDEADAASAEDRVTMDAAPPPPMSPSEPVAEAVSAASAEAPRPALRAVASEREEAKKESADKPTESTLTASIELSGWNPDAPYLANIRKSEDPYAAYLQEREANRKTPSFYLDVADYLRSEKKSARLALRVLSNLAELDTENIALTGVLAYRLGQWDLYALAVPQFERALAQRGEEPQSYRDLALALSRAPNGDRQRAVELFWKVATGAWDGRFPDIELIALHELNDVLAHTGKDSAIDLRKIGIDERFLDPVAVGLRVVLSWDADNTDIDLWVTDPSGDKAYYSTPHTRTGGHVSRDFTGGYGPEVYSIRRPLPGTYIVEANYFGDRRQSLTGPVTVQLEFQTRFGNVGGQRAAVTRRLEGGSQTIEIGRFKVGQ